LADARVSPDPRRAGGAGRGHAGRRAVRGRDRVCGGGCRRLPLRNASVTTAALIHVVVSGLATGSIYALMALALVIVYNATRTLNFAQGEMLMVSAFLAWTAQRTLGLSWWVAIVIAIAGGALLGFVVEYAIVRRSPTATPGDVLIIPLGLSLVLRALAGMIWSHDEFPF